MTRQQRITLAVAILSAFVTFLDSSVITVALPAIAKELHGGLSAQLWIVDSYLIALGSLILLAGSLADAFGQARVLRIGLIGFGVASALIAVAPNPEILIAVRALQGIAGALITPASLAIIISQFEGKLQARAIGIWSGLTGTAFIAGPLVGGLFVDFLSWRLVFGINVLPIAVTLVLLRAAKTPSIRFDRKSIDWLGAALGVIGLAGPVYALIEQSTYGWTNPAIYLPFAIGLIALTWFSLRQGRVTNPMVPIKLFRVRNFAAGNIATVFFYAALSLGGFVVTVYLQEVAGYSATMAGLASLPISVASLTLAARFGSLAARFGPRLFMGFGPIVGGIGYLLMLSAGTHVNYWTQILPGMALFAVGLAATVSPLTSAVLGSIPSANSGIGSAINNAAARVAALIATAFVGVILAGQLGPASFHRALVVTAAILFVAGVASLVGIRNSRPTPTIDEQTAWGADGAAIAAPPSPKAPSGTDCASDVGAPSHSD